MQLNFICAKKKNSQLVSLTASIRRPKSTNDVGHGNHNNSNRKQSP